MLARVRGASVHLPFQGGECAACHVPHASDNRRLVTVKGTELCVTCHGDLLKDAKAVKSSHPPAKQDCVACHDPHGSLVKPILKKEQKDLCLGCHASMANLFKDAKARKHAPAAQGQCDTCHRPHDSPQPDLLKVAQPGTCTGCHSVTSPKVLAAHGGIQISRATCTGCHNPHGSQAAGLMHEVTHRPFAGRVCSACHK
jgi:predicted CXXCH cytochrome family protein